MTGGRPSGDGLWSPEPLDLIEIPFVLWYDGTRSGEASDRSPWIVAEEAGQRAQLVQVLDILRSAADQPSSASPVADLTLRIAALPDADPALVSVAQRAMQETKATVLTELRHFEADGSGHHAESVQSWLRSTIERYEGWLSRLRPR